MKFSDKIRKARQERGYTQEQLGNMVNINKSSISRYEKGVQLPELENIKKIAKALGVSHQYLLEDEFMNEFVIEEGFIKVPVVSTVKRGLPLLAKENIIGFEYVLKGELDMDSTEYFYLEVKTNDMVNARIHKGDRVLIRKQTSVHNEGDIMLVRIRNEEAILRRVYSKKEGIVLQSENVGYPPTFFTKTDIANKDVIDLYRDVVKTHWNPETSEIDRKGLKKYITVKEAIGDLPPVDPGEDASTSTYNYPCNNAFLERIGKAGIYPLMDHIARKHNALDRERFAVMINNHWSFGQLRKEMPQYEHEHARVFDNSYVVQWWDLPSKTILAHIHKDGFQFIHPDEKQARSFTVREAARIQSFPDDFEFAGSRGEKYKQIGNAVPVNLAAAIGRAVIRLLNDIEQL